MSIKKEHFLRGKVVEKQLLVCVSYSNHPTGKGKLK